MQCIIQTHSVKEVPKEEHTPAFRLFFYPYTIMVQQLFTMDQGLAERWGTPTSGNAKLDKEFRSAWVRVRATPVQMVEFMERGAALQFESFEDATRIYLDIVEHLRGWIKAFDVNPNLRRAPLEDLRQLDELAARVYPYANPNLLVNEDDGGYGAFVARASRRRSTLASTLKQAPSPPGALRSTYRHLSDAIAERLARRNS